MTILHEQPTKRVAIRSLCAKNHSGEGVLIIGKEADLKDLSCLTVGDNISPSFTWSNVETELQQLQDEWTAQEYGRNRASAYPALADQFDKIFHEGIDKWKETIQAVKDAHPKP